MNAVRIRFILFLLFYHRQSFVVLIANNILLFILPCPILFYSSLLDLSLNLTYTPLPIKSITMQATKAAAAAKALAAGKTPGGSYRCHTQNKATGQWYVRIIVQYITVQYIGTYFIFCTPSLNILIPCIQPSVFT